MTSPFEDRVALVTGGGPGIGRAVAPASLSPSAFSSFAQVRRDVPVVGGSTRCSLTGSKRCGHPDPPVAPAWHQKISSALPSGHRCPPGSDRGHTSARSTKLWTASARRRREYDRS